MHTTITHCLKLTGKTVKGHKDSSYKYHYRLCVNSMRVLFTFGTAVLGLDLGREFSVTVKISVVLVLDVRYWCCLRHWTAVKCTHTKQMRDSVA